MTSHRDDDDSTFQSTIDALQHSSITTKLGVVDGLNDELEVEQAALEIQRAQLHKHRQAVKTITANLKTTQSAEEYTVSGGGGGGGVLPPGKIGYCDASYSGGTDDGSREKPYASVAAALDAKSAVDDSTERIYDLAAGVYTVSRTIVKNSTVKQKITIRGRGPGVTILQAGASFAAGKSSDCLKLTGFGDIRVVELTIRYCKYGLHTVTCDKLDVRHVHFTQCGGSDDSTNYDHSHNQAAQLAAYAANFTDGGALRADSCGALVRVLDCHVSDCNRGLRVGDSVKGGLISGCFVERTAQSAIYSSASTYTGASGNHNFTISGNTVISAGNNSILAIGGKDNTIADNVIKGGWNAPIQLWSCCNCTVSDNKMEKSNFSDWNGQAVLGDAWCGGVVADGDSNIPVSATYQCRITGNVITEPSAGRAADIYAVRIMNTAYATGNKVFVQGNKSQGADIHFANDGLVPPAVFDMDSRAPRPFGPTVYENLTNGDDVQIQSSDKVILIKHDQVENLTVTMPSDAQNGQVFVVKNFHIGDASQGGNYVITVRPAQGQNPAHKIDYKYDTLELKASIYAGGLMSDENEAARLMWYALDATFISLQDAY